MPIDKPSTPEKDLLNLIEKPKGKSPLQAAKIKYQGLSFISLGALRGRFSFFRNKFQGDFKSGAFQFDIKGLNALLKLAALGLGIYFLTTVFTSTLNLRQDLKLKIDAQDSADAKISTIGSFLKAASYYLEKARSRDIFSMVAETPVDSGPKKGPSQKLLEIAQNYKLVGISWSNDPDVMIENTKTQNTFFLKKGQIVENDLKVKEVFKNKVILSLGNEEIELQ